MNPKHISEIKDPKRRAIAPYNFVELPEKVVEAQELPSGDRYHLDRHTGRIECALTTESPLYTRCGLTPDNFAKYSEIPEKYLKPPKNATEKQKKQWEEEKKQWETERKTVLASFFTYRSDNFPVIPGSSIRGMLRTLVEIVGFGKIDQVSGNDRLFFRAVASNPDKESWGREYKQYVIPKKVEAGYLKKDSEGWYIQPAQIIEKETFAWVRQSDINLSEFKNFDDDGYEPQYISARYQNVAVDKTDRAKRLFAHNIENIENIESPKNTHLKKGVLVTSGNMKQGDEDSPRRNHCLVFPVNKKASPLPIDDTTIEHYRNALTDFQKKSPFDKDWGVLKEDRPVFYYHDGQSKTVGFFGQSPNFRIPYSPEGNGHATTVLDFIPTIVSDPYVINWNIVPIRFSVMLLNINSLVGIIFVTIPLIDIADAIFGWVKQESTEKKLPKNFNKQRASRVFVTDALCQTNENDIWYSKTPVTPQILSEPKPSYFPHYLVQQKETKTDPKYLKHYASVPFEETVIRGHKLYWHKGGNPDFKLPPPKKVIGSPQKVSDTQTTLIKPVNKGVTFKFDIHFENLSDVELGALLWVLSLGSDKSQHLKYCFSLGMGKPLGMGAVKIDYELHLSERASRYSQLFNGDKWSENVKEQGEVAQTEINCISEFEKYILDRISEDDYPKDRDRQQLEHLKQIPRIEMLLAMLRCDRPSEFTNYMELECFKARKVLPTSLDIRNIEDKRRFSTKNTPLPNTPSKPTPKPRKKSDCLESEKKVTPPKLKPQKLNKNRGKAGGNINLATQRPTQRPKPHKPKPKR